jgi:hypothetical protein
MSRETVLVAYLVETQSQGVPGFQHTTLMPASEQELVSRIRSETREPEAEVVLVQTNDWDPPEFITTHQDEIEAKFNQVMARVMDHLTGLGVQHLDYGKLSRTGSVLPNPASGKIYFVYKLNAADYRAHQPMPASPKSLKGNKTEAQSSMPHPTTSQPGSSSTTSWLDRPLLTSITLNWESLIFAAILILAVITRFYDLGSRVMSHDENSHVYYSWRLSEGQGYQHTPLTHGPLLFHC